MPLENRPGNIKIKPIRKVYYYRNNHGKVISLDEDVALEQHNLHPEFFGSSEDLSRTGFNINELIAEHLKKHVKNPELPPDKRRVTNFPTPEKVDVQALKEELRQEILKELKNEKPKTKD